MRTSERDEPETLHLKELSPATEDPGHFLRPSRPAPLGRRTTSASWAQLGREEPMLPEHATFHLTSGVEVTCPESKDELPRNTKTRDLTPQERPAPRASSGKWEIVAQNAARLSRC